MHTEQDLLKGAQIFNLDSLGMIYDQYSPGIYRYAMRLLGDEYLAEDCIAETFSRFLRALRSGMGPKDHLKAYLYRIAHNWITDSYRRQPPAPVELSESIRSDENLLPEKQVDDQFAIRQVRLALRSLTSEQLQVVVLKYFEDLGNEEIAAVLGKQIGAVKALQHRALDTLQKILLREEVEIDKRFAQQT